MPGPARTRRSSPDDRSARRLPAAVLDVRRAQLARASGAVLVPPTREVPATVALATHLEIAADLLPHPSHGPVKSAAQEYGSTVTDPIWL